MKNNSLTPTFLGESENVFVQANHFIQARYKEPLSYWESVIFAKMCSLISPMDTDFQDYRVYIKDLIHLLDVTKTGRVYEDFIEAANRLRTREIVIKFSDENGKEMILDTALITGVARLNNPDKKDEVFVDLNIHPKLVPFLLELKSDFTQLDLRDYKHLHSGSIIRLYHILKSHWGRGNRSPEIEIEQLKGMLGVGGKYALYTNFKARVLEDARRRLLDGMRLAFSYEEKKEAGRGGGRVVAIRFKLFPNTPKNGGNDVSDLSNEQGTLFSAPIIEKNTLYTEGSAKDAPTDEWAAKILSFGVKAKQLKQLTEEFSEAEILKATAVTEEVIANKKLKTSAAGFFVSALKNGYEPNLGAKVTQKNAEKDALKPSKTAKELGADADKLSSEDLRKAEKVAQRAAETRQQFEKEKAIIEQLVAEDLELVNEAVAEIRRGMFGFTYNEAKTFAENRENKVFEAAFLNTIKKLRSDLFK
jgi:plasmid replication initiation protein